MRASRFLPLLALYVLILTGCMVGWYRPAEPLPQAFRQRQRVQVWRGGAVLALHGVRLSADSVTGVPLLQAPDCAKCRLGFARRDIDSIRVGGMDDSSAAAIGIGTFVAGLALAIYSARYYGD